MKDKLVLTSKGTEYLAKSKLIKVYAEARRAALDAEFAARLTEGKMSDCDTIGAAYCADVVTLNADCMAQQEAIDTEYFDSQTIRDDYTANLTEAANDCHRWDRKD